MTSTDIARNLFMDSLMVYLDSSHNHFEVQRKKERLGSSKELVKVLVALF